MFSQQLRDQISAPKVAPRRNQSRRQRVVTFDGASAGENQEFASQVIVSGAGCDKTATEVWQPHLTHMSKVCFSPPPDILTQFNL